MEYKKVHIRPARSKEALVGARLMYYAGWEYLLGYFDRTEDETVEVVRKMFRFPHHMTSYTYVFVAEDQGNVVGSFSGFDARGWQASQRGSLMYLPVWLTVVPPWRIPRMVAALRDLALPPVLDKEYYIEFLAALPERRGQRIGKQLLEFAEGQARVKGLKRIVLDVVIENVGARRFYEREGFREAKIVTDPRYCKRFNIQGSIRVAKSI